MLNTFEFIKAISDTVFDMINAFYPDKPLVFIRATFQKKFVSHHPAVNEADSCLLIHAYKEWREFEVGEGWIVCRFSIDEKGDPIFIYLRHIPAVNNNWSSTIRSLSFLNFIDEFHDRRG